LGEATDGLIVDLSDVAFNDSRELAVIVVVDDRCAQHPPALHLRDHDR
jgi:anti-anti-sigma regulatory factor